jgi:arabinofuranosyltransferase
VPTGAQVAVQEADRQATPAVHYRTDPRALIDLFLIGLFAIAVLRSAWMCDDAYVTLRTIDNFVEGNGLRWNVAERVQAFTHPLWLMVLTIPYYFTREAYLTTLAVSMGLSIATVWIFIRKVSVSTVTAVIGVIVFTFSKAFVEYSTSGLENPLTYFLLAWFFLLYSNQAKGSSHVRLWTVAGLMLLDRLDLVLIILPAMAVQAYRDGPRQATRDAAIGLFPLLCWEFFSVVYYGFPLPNTAYAKLPAGLATGGLIAQGLLYLLDSVARDPVTPLAIAAFTLAALSVRRESWPLAAGIALHLSYVVRVGGDFMSGRFLAAPLLLSVALFASNRWRLTSLGASGLVAAVVLLGSFATTRPPIRSTFDTFAAEPRDIYGVGGTDDERAFYSRYTALLRDSRQLPLPYDADIEKAKAARNTAQVVVVGSVGMYGYFAGPRVHIIDPMGLGDPLTARLPASANWRIGHFERKIPDGYMTTVQTGKNAFTDPTIGRLYEELKRITQDPLWSRRRWQAIWLMNLHASSLAPAASTP